MGGVIWCLGLVLLLRVSGECTFSEWSEWTICDDPCNGKQFRRQVCTCDGAVEPCDDSKCTGVPLTEEGECAVGQESGGCSGHWDLGQWSPWSPCSASCGGGTRWVREVCKVGALERPDNFCLYSGDLPEVKTSSCNEAPCCEWTSSSPIDCSTLFPDLCSFSWLSPVCSCNGIPTRNYYKCPLTSQVTPFTFNSNQTCYSEDTAQKECLGFLPSGECVSWNASYTPGDPTPFQTTPFLPAVGCVSCYNSWSAWSNCTGECDNAFQWRHQVTSNPAQCTSPPQVEFQSCSLPTCCAWGEWTDWSDCNVTCGTGVQWRQQTCSCSDNSCPGVLPFETRSCTADCCTFGPERSYGACNATCDSGEEGVRWAMDTCDCPTGSSACDIMNCAGIPNNSYEQCCIPSPSSEPAPDTALPVSPAPETTLPVSPAPETTLPVSPAPETSPQATSPQTPEPAPTPFDIPPIITEPPLRTWSIVLLVVGVCVCVFLIIFVIFAKKKSDDDSSSSSSEDSDAEPLQKKTTSTSITDSNANVSQQYQRL